jgi:hypothetical protein
MGCDDRCRVSSMKKFSDTQPKQDQEKDRDQLKAGVFFVITGYFKQESSKYPEGIAKINGYDIIGKKPVKYWYTGKAVIHQLDNMKKTVGMMEDGISFKEEIKVTVVEVKSDKGKYLSLADPV